MKKIELAEISDYIDPIVGIRKEHHIISAEANGVVNAMTAGTVSLGNIIGTPAAYVFIRPDRFTREFIEKSGHFTITVIKEGFNKDQIYIGSHSGRTEPDKISKTRLKVVKIDGQPTFEQARLTINCKLIYAHQLEEKNCTDDDFTEKFMEEGFSYMYIGRIESAYICE